jgi:hypothetical protein
MRGIRALCNFEKLDADGRRWTQMNADDYKTAAMLELTRFRGHLTVPDTEVFNEAISRR